MLQDLQDHQSTVDCDYINGQGILLENQDTSNDQQEVVQDEV